MPLNDLIDKYAEGGKARVRQNPLQWLNQKFYENVSKPAVGTAVGRNIGDGKGRVAAGIAGAVLGAAAGNAAAMKHNTTTSYQTLVRMDDGSLQTLSHSGVPKWREGQEVQLNNGAISPR